MHVSIYIFIDINIYIYMYIYMGACVHAPIAGIGLD